MTVPGDRYRLLARTDVLLDQVEQLRLRDVAQVPDRLRDLIARLADELGKGRPSSPKTTAGAHNYLFRLQEGLVDVAEPAVRSAGRRRRRAPALQPLALPSLSGPGDEAASRERVQLTVQRAHDRARYTQAQAETAERQPDRWGRSLVATRRSQANAARENFDHLLVQAERLAGGRVTIAASPRFPTEGHLRVDDLVVDLDRQRVARGGMAVALTDRERAYLVLLMANPGRVITREAILHAVHGDDPGIDPASRAIDVHIAAVRAKLDHPRYLATVPGIGFQLQAEAKLDRGRLSAREVGLDEGSRPPVRLPANALQQSAELPRLTLPDRSATGDDADWIQLSELTVQRAYDCMRYLEAQALAARDLQLPGASALAERRSTMATSARERFARLFMLAERLTGRTPSVAPLPALPTSGQLRAGEVQVDLDREQVRRGDHVVPLGHHERTVLAVLLANPGRVVTREALMGALHGPDPTVDIRSPAVRVYLHSAFGRLGSSLSFETVRGIGYRLALAADLEPQGPRSRAAVHDREERRAQRRAAVQRSRASPPVTPPSAGPASSRRFTR